MFDVAENGVDIVWIVVLSLIFSFAMAWAIGANDVANTVCFFTLIISYDYRKQYKLIINKNIF